VDSANQRLFVANKPNDTLDIIDLKAGKLVKQVAGQKKIQGIAYVPELDRIFVGNGGGACNVLDGKTYEVLKSIPLDDADNVRYQPATGLIYVTHAPKGLAVIDAKTLELKTDIQATGATEGFALETGRPRLYLNTVNPNQVAVIDTAKLQIVAGHPVTLAKKNTPLALDEANHRAFLGCRTEPMIIVMDTETGKEITSVAIPPDIDDLVYDAKCKRLYASCGAGFLAVIAQKDADHYELVEKIATAKLARTEYLDLESGQLFLGVPRQEGQDGPAIWVYRTRP
jgi:DNA-binding beta-propeller fold protein YncE